MRILKSNSHALDVIFITKIFCVSPDLFPATQKRFEKRRYEICTFRF